MRYIVVFVTAPSKSAADKMASGLLSAGLCACVNMVPGVKSVYIWKGRKASSNETLMIIKTRKSLFKKLCSAVKKMHSYKVPEIISLPVSAGYRPYLKWIDEMTK